MKHARAAIFEGKAGHCRVRSVPLPEPTAAEVLVKVLGCTLCGSDLHSLEGRRSVPVPTVLGHEIVGEVLARGDSAPATDLAGRALRVGDRVTWAIVASCGACPFCLRGLPQKCLKGVKYGHETMVPGRELLGGLASHCLLVPGTAIARLPDDLPLEVACPTSCATATVAAALEAAGGLEGRRVCLFGLGMLGLTAAAMTRARGAAEVVGVDPDKERRAQAPAFGASRVAGLDEFAGVEASGDLFDVVIELSGSPAAFVAAWPRVQVGGTIVLVGSVFPGAPVSIALEQVVRRHLTIRGVHNYAPRHLVTAVDFLAAEHKKRPFAELVAEWYPLAAVDEAFARALRGGAIRVGVRPEGPTRSRADRPGSGTVS